MIKEQTKQGENTLYIKTEPRVKFTLDFPIYKRIWRLLMLVVKGWCYFD